MKTNKKVLSLLLALVMVFSTAVTAFAEGSITKENYSINLTADINDVKDGANLRDADVSFKVAEAGAEVQAGSPSYSDVTIKTGDKAITNGEGKLVFDLEANKDYYVAVDPILVLPGTSYNYKFSTNANAEVIGELPTFHFDLFFKPAAGHDFTVYSVDENAKSEGNVKFKIYPVKVKDDTANPGQKIYDLGADRAFQADLSATPLDTRTTNANKGIYGYTQTSIDSFKRTVNYDIDGTTVVAFVVNGEVVAFSDLSHDSVVVLKPVKVNTKVEITVLGDDGNVLADGTTAAPKALKGAKVELVPNTTKLWEEETWGTAVDSKTTGENGKALFENVELSSVLSYLNNQEGNLEEDDSPLLNVVTRFNKLVVTTADGYKVPVDVRFTSSKTPDNDGVIRYTVTLYPEGYEYISRINGSNRYATSVEVAKATYTDDEYKTVILASGDVYADALVANGIAGMMDKPLVLTAKASLSPEVEAYLKGVKPEEVLIVGGAGSVSAAVQAKLETMGIRVGRIAGSNRYDTSVKVLDAMFKLNPTAKVEKVLLASGENFADALVASVPSAIEKQPILLTEAKALSAPVKAAFNNTDYGIKNVIVIGGNSSVSDNAVAEIGLTAVERLSGQNRQLTSMIVANKFFTNGGQAIIADGTGFADALSAGQFASKKNAPILLTESKTTVGKDLTEYIKTNKMTQLTIVGGSSSVAKTIADQLEAILAGK